MLVLVGDSMAIEDSETVRAQGVKNNKKDFYVIWIAFIPCITS